jgi:AGCS family alanine or glycine:cation symporter
MYESFLKSTDIILFATCVLLLAGSVLITFKTRFVQIRYLPAIFKMFISSFLNRNQAAGKHTIQPHKALFTAMSTTLGIGTIVAPVIAIHWGGPGALLGFLLTSFFGSAATFLEVNLCIQYRKTDDNGGVMGGPMQYLKLIFSPAAAKWYAIFGFVLMVAWSGAQANQVAAVLDSPLLGDFRIHKSITGFVIAALVIVLLFGGIKRIGSFSAKLVPFMFILYVGSCLWIVGSNLDQLTSIFGTIFTSAF